MTILLKKEKMKIDNKIIEYIIEKDSKCLSAFIMMLNIMKEGDEFTLPTGKVIKLDDNKFKIKIDNSVISKGLDRLFDSYTSIDYEF